MVRKNFDQDIYYILGVLRNIYIGMFLQTKKFVQNLCAIFLRMKIHQKVLKTCIMMKNMTCTGQVPTTLVGQMNTKIPKKIQI